VHCTRPTGDQPLRARGYFLTPGYIPPRTVINVKNDDNRCFEWAILSALYPIGKDPQRTSKYQAHLGKLNFTGIEFPVKVSDLDKFEQQNPDIAIYVFRWDNGPCPLRHSECKNRTHNIDLLFLTNDTDQHYVWIKDLGRLCYRNSKHEHKKHVCRRCIHPFSTAYLLEDHSKYCEGIGKKPQRTKMPEEGKNTLKFTNHHKHMKVPYIIIADFEALNISVEGAVMDPHKSNTRLIAEQKPCSYCYIVIR